MARGSARLAAFELTVINPSFAADTPQHGGYYGSTRSALLDLLAGRRPASALEIGCGTGANLREMRRRFPGCRTTGVELRPDAAEVARSGGDIDEIVMGDVLDPAAVTLGHGRFDVIILSHVLEHFVEPERVVARALEWMKPDACLLIALPNLRHLWLLRELVWRGDFEYRDAGILDRTHLRFFTRKSALRFLAAQGLQVEQARADVEGRKSRLLDKATFGVASEFTAAAFNFLAIRERTT